MSRIYKTNPYYEIPSTTVKIVYDDDKPEFEGEELPIEELTIDTLAQTYGHAEEEKTTSEKELLEKEKAEIALKQKEADEMLARAKEVLAKAQADAEIFMKNTKEEAYKLRDQIIDEGLSHVEEKQQEGYSAGFVAHENEINQVFLRYENLSNCLGIKINWSKEKQIFINNIKRPNTKTFFIKPLFLIIYKSPNKKTYPYKNKPT